MCSDSPIGAHVVGSYKLYPESEYVRKPYDPSILCKAIGSIDPNDYPYPKFSVKEVDVKREYYYVMGPWFNIPELCFPGASAEDYRMGVSRMLALRKPELLGFSDRLRSNQSRIAIRYRGYIHRFQKFLHHHLIVKDHEEAYFSWLYQPHAKRKLRMQVHNSDLSYLDLFSDPEKPVEYKLKPGELLTQGKKRGIGDLSAKRTQISAWCIAQLKEAWAVPYIIGRSEARFIPSPDKNVLKDTFDWLMTPSLGDFRFVYFSDDCSFSVGAIDGVFMANGDISQCDGSHYDPIFDTLFEILVNSGTPVYHDALKYAFDALGLPLTMRNKHNYAEKVQYFFNSKRLYSGSVLTTIINNYANLLIFFAFCKRCKDFSLCTRSQLSETYRLAAQDVGYIVKCKVCDIPEDLQFLKHSPVLAHDGDYYPVMNLGTFFRGFGAVYGDLSHVYGNSKVPLEVRTKRYLSDVVVSRRNWGDHSINDAFLNKYATNSTIFDPTLRGVAESKSTGGAGKRVDILSLSLRYRMFSGDVVQALEELIHHIKTSDIGVAITLPFLSHLYAIDYG